MSIGKKSVCREPEVEVARGAGMEAVDMADLRLGKVCLGRTCSPGKIQGPAGWVGATSGFEDVSGAVGAAPDDEAVPGGGVPERIMTCSRFSTSARAGSWRLAL